MENTEVTYELYLLDEGHTSPTDGTLLAKETVLYPLGGYHRLELVEGHMIPKGRDYSVVVTLYG